MSEPEFALTPPKWMTAAVEDIVRSLNNPFGIDPDNMINNYTRTDRTPSWLARRKQFAKDWKRMQKLGLKNEFLDHAACYECGGELKVTTNTTHLVGTPNPDYIPPAPLVGNSITIPRANSTQKSSHGSCTVGDETDEDGYVECDECGMNWPGPNV